MMLILIGGIVGVVLGLRCKVFVVFPVTCIALAVVVLEAGAQGHGLWRMALMMVGTVTCLQLGYVLGSAIALMTGISRVRAHQISAERSLPQSSSGYF